MAANDVLGILRVAADTEEWDRITEPTDPDRLLSTAQLWESHRIDLARTVSLEDFSTVADAFRMLDRLLGTRRGGEAGEVVEAVGVLERVSDVFSEAIDRLDQIAT
jgi:hypothetical protein